VSKGGYKLHFENNVAACPETGEKYELCNGIVKEV